MSITSLRIAKIPYLNSVPFFHALIVPERFELVECVPTECAAKTLSGEAVAGLIPAAEYLRHQDALDRVGHFGIAARGRAYSALLLSRRPVRQLDGAVISVTGESATTAALLRVLLERRWRIQPAAYRRGDAVDPEAEAVLLIGDRALAAHRENRAFPYELDLSFEWWLWQHVPMVFAVWAVRKDASAEDRRLLEHTLARSLMANSGDNFEPLAAEVARLRGLNQEAVHQYLTSYVYRLGQAEEQGMATFRALLDAHGLLTEAPVAVEGRG